MAQLDGLMDPFAIKEIKRYYPACEGWNVRAVSTPARDCRIFRVERKEMNISTGFSVLTCFSGSVPAQAVEALERESLVYPRKYAGKIRNTILVPLNAGVTGLPETCRVITMKQFSVEGKSLAWLKKPVAKTAESPVAGQKTA